MNRKIMRDIMGKETPSPVKASGNLTVVACTDFLLEPTTPLIPYGQPFIYWATSNVTLTVQNNQSVAGVDGADKITVPSTATYFGVDLRHDLITDPHQSAVFSVDVYVASSGLKLDLLTLGGFGNSFEVIDITTNQWNTITRTIPYNAQLQAQFRNFARFRFNTGFQSGNPPAGDVYIKNFSVSYEC